MLVKVPRGKARHYSTGCGVTAPRKPKSLTDANLRLDKHCLPSCWGVTNQRRRAGCGRGLGMVLAPGQRHVADEGADLSRLQVPMAFTRTLQLSSLMSTTCDRNLKVGNSQTAESKLPVHIPILGYRRWCLCPGGRHTEPEKRFALLGGEETRVQVELQMFWNVRIVQWFSNLKYLF